MYCCFSENRGIEHLDIFSKIGQNLSNMIAYKQCTLEYTMISKSIGKKLLNSE